MTFGESEKQYSKYLIPGLWTAGISWKYVPFKQDLLLSKAETTFTAWEWYHLKEQFAKLDIFKHNKFSFEVKKLYSECQIRNKSDYRLHNSITGQTNIKIRGLSKKNGKDGDDVASSIFEDIANGDNQIHELTTKRLLGLSE